MKNLSIDIETYSSENLAKCGVYRYVESEDFEVLLFGYAVDAQAKVELWHDRTRRRLESRDSDASRLAAVAVSAEPASEAATEPISEVPVCRPVDSGVPVAQLHKRLELIKPRRK